MFTGEELAKYIREDIKLEFCASDIINHVALLLVGSKVMETLDAFLVGHAEAEWMSHRCKDVFNKRVDVWRKAPRFSGVPMAVDSNLDPWTWRLKRAEKVGKN